MTNESSDLILRILVLERIVSDLEHQLLKLQQRSDATEQSIGQKWVS